MSWLRRSLSIAFALLSLAPGGCAVPPNYAEYRTSRINQLAEVRNACLKKNASAFAEDTSDAASNAKAVALVCKSETDQLIALLNKDGDPRVTRALLKDAEFRATGYIMRARGQTGN